MDLGIKGRRAIVNGASAGMGKAAALALAKEGVELVITARGEERLRAAAAEIGTATGVKVTAVTADHSTDEGRERILAACPSPDILVGTCSPPPMTPDYRTIDSAQWQASLETGLLSPVRFMDSVLEGMVARRWGRIVNIASIATKYPLELRILSGATRAARHPVVARAADPPRAPAGHSRGPPAASPAPHRGPPRHRTPSCRSSACHLRKRRTRLGT